MDRSDSEDDGAIVGSVSSGPGVVVAVEDAFSTDGTHSLGTSWSSSVGGHDLDSLPTTLVGSKATVRSSLERL